jgi:hypothetical protein
MAKITLGTSSYKNNNVSVEVRGKGFYRAEKRVTLLKRKANLMVSS